MSQNIQKLYIEVDMTPWTTKAGKTYDGRVSKPLRYDPTKQAWTRSDFVGLYNEAGERVGSILVGAPMFFKSKAKAEAGAELESVE